MAITATTLNSGISTVDSTLYASGAYALTSNQLHLFAVVNGAGSANFTTTPVLERAGATWVSVASVINTSLRVSVFRALPSTSLASAATTIRFAGNAQSYCAWAVASFDGVNTGSTDGAASIVQSTWSTGSTLLPLLSVSLAPFANSSNASYGVGGQLSSGPWSTGLGFAVLSSVSGAAEILSGFTEWGTSTLVTMTGVTTARKTAIGLEIASLPLPSQGLPSPRLLLGVGR